MGRQTAQSFPTAPLAANTAVGAIMKVVVEMVVGDEDGVWL